MRPARRRRRPQLCGLRDAGPQSGQLDASGAFTAVRSRGTSGYTTSSIDPWHSASRRECHRERTAQGFDLFFPSGLTNNLPAMIPVTLLYGTPDDSAAQIAYLKKRGYPIGWIEMGEEPDGKHMLPEDYAALYLQWATALHKVDPALKLGGPVFEGINDDIKVWPDAQGRTSWIGPLRRILARAWTLGRPLVRVAGALPVRAVQHHVEVALPRASNDEARARRAARSRHAERGPDRGHREPHFVAADGTDEHDLRRALAGGQHRIVLRRRRRRVSTIRRFSRRRCRNVPGACLMVELRGGPRL